MSLTLFSKTWINDYPWLKLAIKSVIKMCKEDVDWTIVCDSGQKNEVEKVVLQAVQESKGVLKYKIVEVLDFWPEAAHIGNGYLSQQWIKMNAHKVMGDGLFWNWDSDVIAIKPFTSRTFIGKSERPIYWFSQFNSLMSGNDRPAHEARIAMMKEVLGLQEIPFEWMRCMPIPMYGAILRNGGNRKEWHKSFDMMRAGDHRFSEFNVIGAFSHMFFPDAYEWRNAEAQGPTWSSGYVEGGVGSGAFQEHGIVCQAWSWGGIPPHIQTFVDNL